MPTLSKMLGKMDTLIVPIFGRNDQILPNSMLWPIPLPEGLRRCVPSHFSIAWRWSGPIVSRNPILDSTRDRFRPIEDILHFAHALTHLGCSCCSMLRWYDSKKKIPDHRELEGEYIY